MHIEVDLNKPIQKPKLYICKPNQQTIGRLSEAYNISLNARLASINELTFDIPNKIDINHVFGTNPNFSKIKDRYLVKYKNGLHTEWFILNEITDSSSDGVDVKKVHAFSLGYELTDKYIRTYKCTSYNASNVLADALSNTIWNLGTVSAIFDTLFRSFEVSSKTVLDFVNEIANTFQAQIVWDTVNRTISLYQVENIGTDKGLRFSYGNLLNGVEKKSVTDTMVTRLNVYGQNGLSIQEVNPTGSDSLEDFSYFMKTEYMSQGLIDAINNYNSLLSTKSTEFNNLLSQLNGYKSDLLTKENDLATLNETLKTIQDSIDVALANGDSTTDLQTQKTNQEALITAKQAEIDSIETNITNVETQITTLRNSISLETNFTPEQITERNQYIIEREFVNENYINAQDLYDAAVHEFEKIREPQLSVTIDVVNFLEILEEQRNWDKLVLGDIVTVYYPDLDINIKAKITEIDYDFEGSSIKLTISNVEKIIDDKEKFLQDIHKSISTSTNVNMNSYKWNGVDTLKSNINSLIDVLQNGVKSSIDLAINEDVSISSRGLIIKDPTDPTSYLVANHGVLAITNDNSASWKNAITKDGIVADRLYGRIIAGVGLEIDSSDSSGNKTFTVNSTGVTIAGSSLTITGGLQEEQLGQSVTDKINNSANEAITNFINTTYNTDLSFIRSQIDGVISTWFYNYEPTLLNEPASLWTTDTDKNNHIGDLYYDLQTGYAYRFILEASVYKWLKIIDSDVSKALSDAAKAQDTADHKRRVFVAQPVPPYDIGDLWSQGVNGDLLVCTIAKTTGQSYLLSDWARSNNSVQQGTLYNGVKLDVIDGIKVTRSDDKVQVFLNATTGLKFQQKVGTSWVDKLYADPTTGALTAEDLIANRLIIKNGANTLIDGNTGTIDFSKFTTVVGKLSATNVDTTNLTVQSANVTGTLTANQLDLKGTNLSNFKIDANGNVTIAGNLTMTGGSISWGNISAPSYSQITGTKPPTDAINSTQATTITQSYVSAATIKTNQLTSQGSNPILKLFTGLSVTNGGDPAIDATLDMNTGIGSAIRLKWNNSNYLSIYSGQADFYFNGGSRCSVKSDGFYVDNVKLGTGGGGTAVFA